MIACADIPICLRDSPRLREQQSLVRRATCAVIAAADAPSWRVHQEAHSGCYNFRSFYQPNPHRGRVAQLAEQLTLNQ